MRYISKITSRRTGATGYIDRNGVPHGTAGDAGYFPTEDAARAAFDAFADSLIRVTGHCRWVFSCEALADGGGS